MVGRKGLTGEGTAGRVRFCALLALLALGSACTSLPEAPAPPPLERPAAPGDPPAVAVRVDSLAGVVLVEAGPFRIPQVSAHGGGPGEHGGHGGGHDHHGAVSPLLLFDWPVDGWYRGFRVRVVDADGDTLPRDLLHHAIGVNFERRQPVYPVAERFMGVGTETGDIVLPESLGIPMERGSRLGIYASWNNETGAEIDAAYLRAVLVYTPADTDDPPEEVLPIYIDTNNEIGGTNAFDLPPGRTARTYEFTVPVDGALLGMSGHLHDHGRNLRLEDAATGEVLVRLDGIADGEGRILGVEKKIFRSFFGLLDRRVPLEAGRRYRIVGEYFNPTGRTLEQGAMAHMSGVFAPAKIGAWARLDPDSEAYRKDVAALPRPYPPERAPEGFPEP